MARGIDNPWLRRFSFLTAFCTLILICFGGLVTSKGAGLAVPDWPNTYGYNMFFFPISKWVGGIFYEHTHRLVASGVGLLTTILAVWLWLAESRALLRWLGVAAWIAVVVQGVLGGLRVTQLKDEIGIFHATLAQLFFVLVTTIGVLQTGWWRRLTPAPGDAGRFLRGWLGVATGLVLVQLVLGATMRHQHAGLAVPDFPLAYGRIWPSTDASAIERYNQARMEVQASRPITAAHVWVHMLHRVGALTILATVLTLAWRAKRSLGGGHSVTKATMAWCGLLLVQASLGAFSIWTGKSADIATAHVAVGSVCLVWGSQIWLSALRIWPAPHRPVVA